MKIECVETYRVGDRWLFVEITTDTGIVGLGEAGLWGYPDAAERVVQAFKDHLIGADPLRIEHHQQFLYRNAHFRGAAVSGALGGIDIALWDIAGKHFDAPAWQLLGGKCRDKIRCYIHVGGETPEELVVDAQRAVDRGFTAVRFAPLPAGYESMRYSRILHECVARVGAVREQVGHDVDLCVEIHRRFTPMEAMGLAQDLVPFHIFFLEDPILPDSVQTKGALAHNLPVPVATGERLHTVFEFRELLQAGGCRFVRPDICLAGGITQCKKIAALAESFQVGVIPHNPLSPVSTAACVQLDACIPNFSLQEYTGEDRPPKNEIVRNTLRLDGGYLIVPEEPGIGIALNHDVLDRYPPAGRSLETPLHEDGSVADR